MKKKKRRISSRHPCSRVPRNPLNPSSSPLLSLTILGDRAIVCGQIRGRLEKKKEKDAEEDEKGVEAKEGGGGEQRGRGANSF